jgi:hypothetical protein
LYSGLTAIATTVTTAFNTAVKMNPVGLIISLLTTAATAFFLFKNKAAEATVEQRKFNEVIEEGNRLLGQNKTLEERAAIAKNLSKQQLEGLQTDLETQLKTEDDFHAKLLANLKTTLDSDEKLRLLNEQRKQSNLTQVQKISLDAQANARQKELAMELENENNANQKRIQNLKKHLGNVSTELKNRPATTITPGGTPDTGTPGKSTSPFETEAPETEAPLEIPAWYIQQSEAEALRLAEKKASEEEWTAFLKKQVEEQIDILDEGLKKDEENFEIEKQLTEARKQLKSEYINAIGQVAGALSSMFKEGSAAQIAALAIEKGAAIAQIIFQTAIANAKAVAASPLTAGQPWVAINTVSAVASIASIVATTISSFKDKKNNNTPGYAEGKYPLTTGMHGDKPHMALFNEVPGQPEMVVDGLTTRKLHLNYPEIIRAIYTVRDGRTPQYAEGKYPATHSGSPAENKTGIASGISPEDAKALTTAIQEFMRWKPAMSVELFEKKQMQFQKIKDDNKL